MDDGMRMNSYEASFNQCELNADNGGSFFSPAKEKIINCEKIGYFTRGKYVGV